MYFIFKSWVENEIKEEIVGKRYAEVKQQAVHSPSTQIWIQGDKI